MIHTVFNIVSTVVLLPFLRQLVTLSQLTPATLLRRTKKRRL